MNHPIKPFRLILLFTIITAGSLFFSSLGQAKSPLSKNFVKTKYQRITILVCRMGGAGYDLPVPITPETNYANRTPKRQSATSFKVNKVDVYIDDDPRLHESVPDYPLLAATKIPKYEAKYYQNITPQIYQTVNSVFTDKGYQTSDLRQLSAGWDKPFSEMTVKEICTRLQGSADALFIFHYTDCGDSFMDSVKFVKVFKGFSAMIYNLALFDTQTGERLLYYETPYGMGLNLSSIIALDFKAKDSNIPKEKLEIIEDPETEVAFDKGFSIKEKTGLIGYFTTVNIFHFSADEIIQYAMNYIRKGFKDDNWGINITGLEQLVP